MEKPSGKCISEQALDIKKAPKIEDPLTAEADIEMVQ